MSFVRRLFLLFVTMVMAACGSGNQENEVPMRVNSETREALLGISKSRIVFGHHSVGDDLISGLQLLADRSDIAITFLDYGERAIPPTGGVFIHFRPSENGDPKGKIDEFFSLISEQEESLRPDLALMKLCYADFRPGTDIQELAEYYEQSFQRSSFAVDSAKVMQVTTPLLVSPDDLKAKIKRIIGYPVWEDQGNEQRRIYNEIISQRFSDYPLFDLALAESTISKGDSSGGRQEEASYSLAKSYARDRGHLNQTGKQVLGSAFAIALWRAIQEQSPQASDVVPDDQESR